MTFTWRDAQREREALERDLADRIKTVADALKFCDELDATPDESGKVRKCVKATMIRSWLKNNPFWSENQARILHCISSQRNIICLCHKTGSYTPRGQA